MNHYYVLHFSMYSTLGPRLKTTICFLLLHVTKLPQNRRTIIMNKVPIKRISVSVTVADWQKLFAVGKKSGLQIPLAVDFSLYV